MSHQSQRWPALLAAALFMLPVASVFSPTAAATSATVTTDPAGDSTGQPGSDLLQLDMSTDPLSYHFTLLVDARPAAAEDYQIQFKGPEQVPTTYNVIVQYNPDSQSFGPNALTQDTDAQSNFGDKGADVTASWVGNSVVIDIPRSDVPKITPGKALSGIFAETFDPALGFPNDDQTVPVQSFSVPASSATVPAAPVLTVAAYATHVDLSWNAPYNGGAAISGYTVYLNGSVAATVTGRNYTDTHVTTGASYTYQVSATNSAGQSAKSAPVTVVAVDPTVPSAPTAFVLHPAHTTVDLAWAAPASDGGAAISSYRVYRGTSAGGESLVATLGAVGSYHDTNLTDGVEYFYEVSAANSVGEGPAASGSATPYAAPPPPSFFNTAEPTAYYAGEPSVGYDKAANAYLYQAGDRTFRVDITEGGSPTGKWTDVTPPERPITNNDPIGFIDTTRSNGVSRGFFGGLNGECSILEYTDDAGTTWTPEGNSCAGAVDHESIGGGPYHGTPPATALDEHVYYYCAQQGADSCATSTDGGVTFGAPVTVAGACGSLFGHIKTSAHGIAYVPDANCGNQGYFYTEDNGASWNSKAIPGTTPAARAFDPSIGISDSGDVLYFALADGNAQVPKVVISKDAGATWGPVIDLSHTFSPPIRTSVFQAAVAGDDDRAAIAFIGTTATGGDPYTKGFTGTWDLYVSFTYDGGVSWQTVKASADPVQRGWICENGTLCTTATLGQPGRNLLDFMDAVKDSKGRVAVGYADGCFGSCPTGTADSGDFDAQGTIARQVEGLTLLSQYDVTFSTPSAPTITAYPGANSATLKWDMPADGHRVITGYNVYRGTTSGSETLLQTIGNVTLFTDHGVVDGQTYFYKVAAVNAMGEGLKSPEVSVVPAPDTQPPTQVTGVLVAPGDGVADLSWNPAADNVVVTSYTVTRVDQQGNVVTTNTSGSILHAAGLRDGMTYRFTVRAIDASGNVGAASDPVSAKPVRVATTHFLASDPANDVTVKAADVTAFGIITTDDDVVFEIKVVDANSKPANNAVYYSPDFTVSGVQYNFEYDAGGSRCNLYPEGTLSNWAEQCSITGNTVRIAIARADLLAPFSDGDTISAIALATGTITANGGATGTSKAMDSIPGPLSYIAGAPATVQPPTIGTITGTSGSEGTAIAFVVPGSDADGDALTYTATGLPAGAALDASTGSFSWTPTFAQAGSYPVTFTVDTGAASASKAATLVVADVDRAPTLDAIADQTVLAGRTLTVQLVASDPDGDAVTYSATGLPTGASVNATSGVLTFAAPAHTSGDYAPVATATARGLSSSQAFALHVVDTETAPTLAAVPDQTVAEGDDVTIALAATDADGDALTYAMTGAPADATFDNATGVLRYHAPFANGHDEPAYALHFTVSDGMLTSAQDATLTVLDVNRAPALVVPADKKINETETLAFNVTATDADADAIAFSAAGLPAGATLDGATGAFSWTPTYGQSGNWPIAFSATDGLATTTKTVTVTVGSVDRAPVFDALPEQHGAEGSLLAFTAHAVDPDGDNVTYKATGLPAGAKLASDGAFTWTPSYTQAGTYHANLTATDGNLTSTMPVTLVIADTDRAPVLAALHDVSVLEGSAMRVALSASDPDGTPVALAVMGLPTGATFAPRGAGAGDIAWTPQPGSHGVYPITVTASSNGLDATATFNVTVKFRANFTVDTTAPTLIHASPGQTIDLDADVTNLGVETDTYAFNVSQSAPWGAQPVAPMTLSPGETRHVTLHVKVPAHGAIAHVALEGTSAGQPGAAHAVSWTVDVPVVLTLKVDNQAIHPWQRATGFVRATYLDGTAATGVALSLTQTPIVPLASTLSGTTDANGIWFYDFGNDAAARFLGAHTLLAKGGLPGVTLSTVEGAYTVG